MVARAAVVRRVARDKLAARVDEITTWAKKSFVITKIGLHQLYASSQKQTTCEDARLYNIILNKILTSPLAYTTCDLSHI